LAIIAYSIVFSNLCILRLMDSLQEILGKRDFTPPDEMAAIREYISRRYKANSYVRIQRDAIIVSVRGSALASTLRLEQNRLIEECNIKKRLVIRIGRQ
jgi:hypothetical protein